MVPMVTPLTLHPSRWLIEVNLSSVEYPEDHVESLESTEHIHVERDGEVKTQ